MEEKRTESGSHTIYRLDFDNSAYTPIETGNALYPGSRELSHVDAKTFFKVSGFFKFCMSVFVRFAPVTLTH